MQLSAKILPIIVFPPNSRVDAPTPLPPEKSWIRHWWVLLASDRDRDISLRFRYRHLWQINRMCPDSGRIWIWAKYLYQIYFINFHLFHRISFISLHVSRNWTHASGGSKGVPPLQTKIFLIYYSFGGNLYVGTFPWRVGAPSYWESWIRPCMQFNCRRCPYLNLSEISLSLS